MVCNPDFLDIIRTVDDSICVFTNGGHQDYEQEGDLHAFSFTAFYIPSSITDILSLSEVAEGFRVTMYTEHSNSMFVHLPDNKVIRFQQCGSGLYFFDTATKSKQLINQYSFLSTVNSNKTYFTRAEIEAADEARLLQGKIG